MRRLIQDGTIALLSIAVLGYSLLIIQQPLFGLTAAAGLSVSYATWKRKQMNDAVVLAILWSVLAGATWTAKLEFILPAVAVTALVYVGWDTLRGRGRLPA